MGHCKAAYRPPVPAKLPQVLDFDGQIQVNDAASIFGAVGIVEQYVGHADVAMQDTCVKVEVSMACGCV